MTEDRLPITPSKVLPLGNVIGRSPRESTLESADQAAGIFSLYGEPSRDSWLSKSSDQAAQAGRPSHPRTPLRNSITENELEEMDEEHTTNGNGVGMNGNGVGDGDISRSSITSQPTPEIRLTPIKRQDQKGVHPDIARLSPSPRHPLGGSTNSNTSSMSTGRISSAGSSQYPGEEEDAFHVRSTCMSPIRYGLIVDARLEALGVHGDGWEAGVERTRGGPSNASKRSTVNEPDRDREVGETERKFLASLDR
jgi:hypothetical protein